MENFYFGTCIWKTIWNKIKKQLKLLLFSRFVFSDMMCVQLLTESEPFFAYVTGIGFLPRVNSSVLDQIWASGTAIAAQITRIRFFACVSSFMVDQMMFQFEQLATIFTSKALFSSDIAYWLFCHLSSFQILCTYLKRRYPVEREKSYLCSNRSRFRFKKRKKQQTVALVVFRKTHFLQVFVPLRHWKIWCGNSPSSFRSIKKERKNRYGHFCLAI